MALRKISVVMLLFIMVFVGCQQKKERKLNWRSGRGVRASYNTEYQNDPSMNNRSNNNCGSVEAKPGKLWGGITGQNQNDFWTQVYYFTWPSVSHLAPEDQLGYVSAQANQSTGVRFWGNAQSAGGNGSGYLDVNSAEIRIEIFDDRTCQSTADGLVRPPIAIHIKQGLPDFVGASGTLGNGQADLVWQDAYGQVRLQGTYNNQYFQGQAYYTVNGFVAQPQLLGQFMVPTCGFFICQ